MADGLGEIGRLISCLRVTERFLERRPIDGPIALAGGLGPADVAEVAAMTAALRHRGPDDEGVWTEGNVGFGHRRLAVLESLQQLTEERHFLVQRFAREQGLSSPTASLHDVLDRVGDASAGTLRERYNGYMATAKLVREEIAHNVTLIEGIRGVVEQVLSVGGRAVPGSDLYGQGGRAAQATQGTVFLQQQA